MHSSPNEDPEWIFPVFFRWFTKEILLEEYPLYRETRVSKEMVFTELFFSLVDKSQWPNTVEKQKLLSF